MYQSYVCLYKWMYASINGCIDILVYSSMYQTYDFLRISAKLDRIADVEQNSQNYVQ